MKLNCHVGLVAPCYGHRKTYWDRSIQPHDHDAALDSIALGHAVQSMHYIRERKRNTDLI